MHGRKPIIIHYNLLVIQFLYGDHDICLGFDDHGGTDEEPVRLHHQRICVEHEVFFLEPRLPLKVYCAKQ